MILAKQLINSVSVFKFEILLRILKIQLKKIIILISSIYKNIYNQGLLKKILNRKKNKNEKKKDFNHLLNDEKNENTKISAYQDEIDVRQIIKTAL